MSHRPNKRPHSDTRGGSPDRRPRLNASLGGHQQHRYHEPRAVPRVDRTVTNPTHLRSTVTIANRSQPYTVESGSATSSSSQQRFVQPLIPSLSNVGRIPRVSGGSGAPSRDPSSSSSQRTTTTATSSSASTSMAVNFVQPTPSLGRPEYSSMACRGSFAQPKKGGGGFQPLPN